VAAGARSLPHPIIDQRAAVLFVEDSVTVHDTVTLEPRDALAKENCTEAPPLRAAFDALFGLACCDFDRRLRERVLPA
jgi:hypothetical protein